MAASHCTLSKSSGKPTSKSKSGTRTAARDSNKTIWSTRSRQGAARTVSLESRSKTNALPQSSDTDIVPSTLQAVTENVADVDLVSERSDFSAMNTGNTEREDTMNPPVDPSGFKPGPSNHESRSRSRSRSPRRASRDRSDGRGKKRRKHHHTHDISSSDDEASTIRQLKIRLAALEEYQNPPFYGQCPPFMPNYQPSFFPDPSEDDDPLKLLETDSTLEEGECKYLDSVLSIITEGTDSNQKGKALSTSAHNLVKNFFDKEPDVKVIKELRDRYAEPENCENLAAKTLNPEIERFLKKPAQRRDNCLKGIQASVAAGAVANLRQIDDISAMHKSGQFDPELCRKLLRTVFAILQKSSLDATPTFQPFVKLTFVPWSTPSIKLCVLNVLTVPLCLGRISPKKLKPSMRNQKSCVRWVAAISSALTNHNRTVFLQKTGNSGGGASLDPRTTSRTSFEVAVAQEAHTVT